MSYYQSVVNVAKKIQSVAQEISDLKKERNRWTEPKSASFHLLHHTYVTREDGTTPPRLEGIKREALKAYDELIFAKQNELEGLRFKLVNLAKQGGTA